MLSSKVFFTVLHSVVEGHEGECRYTWVNRNTFCHRIDRGISGFFKNTKSVWGIPFKVGKEFHGIIKGDKVTDENT